LVKSIKWLTLQSQTFNFSLSVLIVWRLMLSFSLPTHAALVPAARSVDPGLVHSLMWPGRRQCEPNRWCPTVTPVCVVLNQTTILWEMSRWLKFPEALDSISVACFYPTIKIRVAFLLLSLRVCVCVCVCWVQRKALPWTVSLSPSNQNRDMRVTHDCHVFRGDREAVKFLSSKFTLCNRETYLFFYFFLMYKIFINSLY